MDLGSSYSIVEGQLISDKIHRVVAAIHDYEPRIEIQWIPDRGREFNVPAFKVIYHDESGYDLILFHVQTEEEFDNRVLQRIIVNDQRNGSVGLSEYEAWLAANEAVARQKQLDDLEATADVVSHILKSSKNDYKVSDKFRIKEGIPFNVAGTKYE